MNNYEGTSADVEIAMEVDGIGSKASKDQTQGSCNILTVRCTKSTRQRY